MSAPAPVSAARGTGMMRAAVVSGPRAVRLERVPRPEPGPGQVRLRLEGSGVCGSSLPLWEGRPWFAYPLEAGAPGHEGWGRVEALGDGVASLTEGDRVAVLSSHAYAELDVAPADACVRLPAALDGRPFPGEPLGCAMNVFRRSDVRPGQTVAILGVGFLGAVLVRLAVQAGARVVAASRRPFAQELARRLGAEVALPMERDLVLEAVKARTGGAGADRTIEVVGLQEPLDLAGELTRERGRLVIAGYHQDGLRRVNLQLWNWRGLDVVNAHEREERVYAEGMRLAVDAVASGVLDPDPLYTHTFPLAELGAALDAMRERPDGFLKALVTA